MRGRNRPLTPPALPLALLVLLLAADEASAHRLEADYVVLPGRKVQVESWFDITGDVPKGARVQVFRAEKELLTEGQLDENGVFVFAYEKAEPLRVVVTAVGHGKELRIPETALANAAAPNPAADAEEGPHSPVPLVNRSSSFTIKDVLIGIGFLLALAAFVLSLRNARRLRELQRAMNHRGTEVTEARTRIRRTRDRN